MFGGSSDFSRFDIATSIPMDPSPARRETMRKAPTATTVKVPAGDALALACGDSARRHAPFWSSVQKEAKMDFFLVHAYQDADYASGLEDDLTRRGLLIGEHFYSGPENVSTANRPEALGGPN